MMPRPKSALVLFGTTPPTKSLAWWGQFNTLIAPEALRTVATAHRLTFEPLEGLVDPGSIAEATAFLHELATLELPSGVRVSESVTYKGYELWWAHYDQLYLQQCLPYTQYRRLLARLQEFSSITLEKPPAPALFRAFLDAHGCHYTLVDGTKRFPPVGIWVQVLISLISWPLLILKRPKILVYTGDLFDGPRDYSFRMGFIYQELRGRKLPFVEFVRSLEPTRTMLAHAWRRRRPVIYSYAIKVVLTWLASFGSIHTEPVPASRSAEERFKFLLASLYVRNVRGLRWSIRVMQVLVRSIGIRAALIPAMSNRTFAEVLGCRLAGVPAIGILHGAASHLYNVYDFMPEYRGSKRISLDTYGMWSAWWRDYYLAHGTLYSPEQLVVSGPMRPITTPPVERSGTHGGKVRVLFIAEQLAEPREILPYLEALMGAEHLELFFKFRPYNDGFEEWLKKHRPDLIARMDPEHVLRGSMPDAISHADVVVGSHSTAVLEAVLHGKPMVFFTTKKWGDYFDLAPMNARYGILATSPEELLRFIAESSKASRETLEELRDMFFGDPYKNGSSWLVDELEKHL